MAQDAKGQPAEAAPSRKRINTAALDEREDASTTVKPQLRLDRSSRNKPPQDGDILTGPIFIPKNQRERLRLSVDEHLGYAGGFRKAAVAAVERAAGAER
jgi:hypothetical protein